MSHHSWEPVDSNPFHICHVCTQCRMVRVKSRRLMQRHVFGRRLRTVLTFSQKGERVAEYTQGQGRVPPCTGKKS